MSVQQSLIVGGVVLAVAVVLGTIVARLVPTGFWRRNAEDLGIILGCASAPLALLARFTHHRSWPYAAVIAIAYGGFYLIRMRQLRNADRDGVRRLLGLHKDASYGEVLLTRGMAYCGPQGASYRAATARGAVPPPAPLAVAARTRTGPA